MMEKQYEWDRVLPCHVYHTEEIHWPKYSGTKKMVIDGERLTCRTTHTEGKVEILLHFWHLQLTIKQDLDVRPKTK